MEFYGFHLYIILLFFGLSISVCCSVKITKFNVSSSHLLRNDVDSNDLILDCDYDIDRIEHGFVLKWLFNNSQIYQWIPGQKPSITFSSFMRDHINGNYSASSDENKRHRALAIKNPQKNMSGNYTCSVSTYTSNDIRVTHLQMIIPHSEFILNTKYNSERNEYSIECIVKNVYPEPDILIITNNKQYWFPKKTKQDNVTNLYWSTVLGSIRANDVTDDSEIDCMQKIPGTNYKRLARNGVAAFHTNSIIWQALIIIYWTTTFSFTL